MKSSLRARRIPPMFLRMDPVYTLSPAEIDDMHERWLAEQLARSPSHPLPYVAGRGMRPSDQLDGDTRIDNVPGLDHLDRRSIAADEEDEVTVFWCTNHPHAVVESWVREVLRNHGWEYDDEWQGSAGTVQRFTAIPTITPWRGWNATAKALRPHIPAWIPQNAPEPQEDLCLTHNEAMEARIYSRQAPINPHD